jgi:hypothetical protein
MKGGCVLPIKKGGIVMASRAKRKRQRREQKRIACMTNGERLIELFEKGAKGVDITSAIYCKQNC